MVLKDSDEVLLKEDASDDVELTEELVGPDDVELTEELVGPADEELPEELDKVVALETLLVVLEGSTDVELLEKVKVV